MTPEHLHIVLREERERGREALKEALTLVEAGLPHGASVRAYFAAFHLSRALVLLAGEEPRKHRGVAHFLNLHYVRTGLLEPEMGRRYAALQRFREDADYQVSIVLDLESARLAVKDAEDFVARCERLLDGLGR